MSDILGSSEPSSPVSTPPSSTPPSPLMQALDLKDIDVSEDDKKRAAEIKAEANKAFLAHDFLKAATLYGEAIDLNPIDATYWLNRATARMKLEEYGYAHADASRAIQIDPKYTKAYYRRATCSLQILKYKDSIRDFKQVVKLDPKNDLAKAQLAETQKLLRRMEFEKAIETEEAKSAVLRCREIIAEGGCEMDKDYTGPKLQYEDGKFGITLEFVQAMMEWFKAGKTLPKRYVWEIALAAYDLFEKQPSLVDLPIEEGMTVDVIGDVHGQFYDVLHLFSLTGMPSEKHCLLMNGDLVDRGSWSIEVIVTAFALKWLYPNRMYINRGNHEANEMNRTYGFEGEAKHKHGEQTFKLFAYAFTAMPLATLVAATQPPKTKNSKDILSSEGRKRYFVTHGGLFSKDQVTLEDVRNIKRIGQQPGQEGLMCELLWTDPQELPGRGPSKRGVGIAFGPDVTKRWCTLNGVSGIIRSHEVRQDGYAIEHDGLCTTVFSAPNYVDQTGNRAAFITIDSTGEQKYTQFDAQPHPPIPAMKYAPNSLQHLFR